MKWVKLGDVIEPAGSRAGKESRLPVYSVTKHAGFVPSLEYFTKQVFSRDTSAYKVVNPGDFAYATIHLDEGAIGIAPESALISPMYTIFRTRSTVVCSQYLIRFLKSPRALQAYDSMGNGAIHRRRAISFKALSDLKVPLPSLAEQRRLAAILDQADAIRTKRRQQLDHLDSLTQAIFHEMFPDGSDQTCMTLGELGPIISSGKNLVGQPTQSHPCNRIIKTSAVTSGEFIDTESKPLPADYSPPTANQIRSGDVLFTRASGTASLLGASCLVGTTPSNLYLPDKVWRIKIPNVPAEATLQLLRSHRLRTHLMNNRSGAAGVFNVSRKTLLNAPIPRFDPADLSEFSTQARRVSGTRERAATALAADDALFASLQSRAFRGEL